MKPTSGTLVVAYEPVWPIGTGRTPSLDEIAEVHRFMRARLAARFGREVARTVSACSTAGRSARATPPTSFAVEDVDGALVGGASLTAADFGPIVAAAGLPAAGCAYGSDPEAMGAEAMAATAVRISIVPANRASPEVSRRSSDRAATRPAASASGSSSAVPSGGRCRARSGPRGCAPDQLRPSRRRRDLGLSPTSTVGPSAGARSSRASPTRGCATPRSLGRPQGGSLGPRRLGSHLLRDPGRLSPTRRQPRPRACRLDLAPARPPGARGLPDDHRKGQGDHLGRALPRQPQHLQAAGFVEVGRPFPGAR